MTGHTPLVAFCLDAIQWAVAGVADTSINRFRVEQIGKVYEARLPAWAIVINAKLCIVMNGKYQ